MWMIAELIIGYIFIIIEIDIEDYYIQGSIISKLFILLIIESVSFTFFVKLKNELIFKNTKKLLIIPICSILVISNIFYLCMFTKDKFAILFSMNSSIIVLVLNIALFKVYEKIAEQYEIKKQSIIFEQALKMNRKQMVIYDEMLLKLRRSRHDIKKHCFVIYQLAKTGNTSNLMEYIEGIIEEYEIDEKIINTNNFIIDSILNYGYTLCQKENIKFKHRITIPNKLTIKDEDICIILMNALENAIEANMKLMDKETREIKISINYIDDKLLIGIKNRFDGYVVKGVSKNLETTKNDRENHGIGLISIKKVVEKYKGFINTEIDDREFAIIISIPNTEKLQ